MKHIKVIEQDPLVSIVIPAYNAERFIGQTLDCATKQTCFPLTEVIIVNDGSTDKTRDIINHFMCFRNFRVLDKKNGGFGGPGDALNVGHKAARGKYITWWSADNVYFPNFCEIFLGALENARMHNHACELMYSDFCYIDEQGRRIQDVVHQKPQGPKDLIEGYDVGMSFMYSKALWERTGEFWTRICEDFNWTVRAAQHTNFGLIRGVLAAFRVHPNQISGHRAAEEKSSADDCRKLAKELFGGKLPEEEGILMPFVKQACEASC